MGGAQLILTPWRPSPSSRTTSRSRWARRLPSSTSGAARSRSRSCAEHDGFDVVGPPGGLADLGGVEFDDAVFARVDAELGHVLQAVPREDVEGMAALRRLRVACRAAKEWLSSSPDTTVEVALPHLSTWVPIRADLESDIRPALMAAVDVVAQTIAASELAPADVHVALLVGGLVAHPAVR